MAEVVHAPLPQCLTCWDDEPNWGVMDGGKVLGPYCRACATKKAEQLNLYQRAVNAATSREDAARERHEAKSEAELHLTLNDRINRG